MAMICPLCGTGGAYLGLISAECTNPRCINYVPPRVTAPLVRAGWWKTPGGDVWARDDCKVGVWERRGIWYYGLRILEEKYGDDDPTFAGTNQQARCTKEEAIAAAEALCPR